MKKTFISTFAVLALAGMVADPMSVHAENSSGTQDMYRLYNPNSGEHFYTASTKERDYLDSIGWNYEGIGWVAPEKSDTPVYRLYNRNGGEHHYTMNANERDTLVSKGWQYEGTGWYSDDNKTVPLFREYNPNRFSCNHNYTTNTREHSHLISIGWRDEGNAWYGIAGGKQMVQTGTKTVVDKPAWDESVVDQEAYDEYVDTGKGVIVCNNCGKKFRDSDAPETKTNPETGVIYTDDGSYIEYGVNQSGAERAYIKHWVEDEHMTGGYYVEPDYEIIHHDAVTHIVHHPAVTHEEPVYEER